MTKRDEFSIAVKRTLAARAGNVCSNPECLAFTSAPHEDATKAINLGVAAHITAAATDGPRYDFSLTSMSRTAIENAIWLCQNCAKLIDSDPVYFTVGLLRLWKTEREDDARRRVGKSRLVSAEYAPELLAYFDGPSLVDMVELQARLARQPNSYLRQHMFDESEEFARNLDDNAIGRLLDHLPAVTTNPILFHNAMDALMEAQAHGGALRSFGEHARKTLEMSEAAIVQLPNIDRVRGYELLANCSLLMHTTRYFEAYLSAGLSIGLGSESAGTLSQISWWNTHYYGTFERNLIELDRALRGDACDYSLARWQVALLMAAAAAEPVDSVLERYSICVDDRKIKRLMRNLGRRFGRTTKS